MASKSSFTSSALETGELPGCGRSEKITDVKLAEEHVGETDGYAKESWNDPSVNKYRLLSGFAAFFAMSLNTSSIGVRFPTA